MTRTLKRVSNRLFNGEALLGRVPTGTGQVEEVRVQTMLEMAYIRSLRGMVRLIDGRSDRSPGLGVAG